MHLVGLLDYVFLSLEMANEGKCARLVIMKKLTIAFVLIFITGFLNPVAAQNTNSDLQRLNSDDILRAFNGQTHNGAYSLTQDGEPTRFYVEDHLETSEAIYSENGISYPGVWSIMRDHLCYDYVSDDMTGGCFKVFQIGNCYFFFGDNIPNHLINLEQNYWTARSVIKGQSPDCDPGVS